MRAQLRGLPKVIGRKMRRYIGAVRREVVVEMVDVLKYTSPIDTRHSVNNWIPTLGFPSTEISGSREHPSNDAQARGLAQVMEEPLESTRVANIANNVFYVQYLNEGWSDQAPPGYIDAAFAQAQVNVRMRLGSLRQVTR